MSTMEELGQPVRQRKAVLTLPDMGLSDDQVESLKGRFQNQIAESMGGQDVLAARRIVVVVVVVIVQ